MIFLHNFTGVYEKQEFYKEIPHLVFDHRKLGGVRGYLDPEAEKELSERLRKEGRLSALHFLDSGNYHHISFVYLGLIEEDFDLVVYDNHTDMQFSAFGGILSCGSWIAEAYERLRGLKKIIIIGAKREYISDCTYQENERVMFADSVTDYLKQVEPRRKVYLSVDKDVLSTDEFLCDWDQGEMSFSSLLEELRMLKEKVSLIGVDICGEPPGEDLLSVKKSDEMNLRLARLFSQSFL